MRHLVLLAACLGLAPGTAAAETPPAAPQAQPTGWFPPDGRPFGVPFPPPPMPKGAFFHLQRSGAALTVKCADDEPMKACVDAVDELLDKANTGH